MSISPRDLENIFRDLGHLPSPMEMARTNGKPQGAPRIVQSGEIWKLLGSVGQTISSHASREEAEAAAGNAAKILKPPVSSAPPGIMNLAQHVGGKVIEDLPPETRNARMMTALLGASGKGNGKTPPAQTAAPQPEPIGPGSRTMPLYGGARGSGEAIAGPTGSKSKPFTVELTQPTVQNLAKQIGQQKKPEEKPSAWRKFSGNFGSGWSAAGKYDPLAWLGRKAGDWAKGLLGTKSKEQPKAETADQKESFLDLAKRLAERNAAKQQELYPDRKLVTPGDRGPLSRFPEIDKLHEEAMRGNRAGRLASADTYSLAGEEGSKGEGGFTGLLKSPPPAAGGAAEGATGGAVEGAATGAAEGAAAGAVEGGAAGAAGGPWGIAIGALVGGITSLFSSKKSDGGKAGKDAPDSLDGLTDAAEKATGGLAHAGLIYVELTTAAYGAAKAVQAYGEAQLESYRDMKRFSGGLAVMFNQLDRQKLLLEARTAANTGGTAQAMSEQQMKLNENMQGLSEDFANIKNTVGTGLLYVVDKLVSVLKVFEYPLHLIAEFCKSLHPEASKTAPIQQLFGQMRIGALGNHAGFKVQRPGGKK